MNTWPTLKEWWQFGGALALEVGILFLATNLIALRLRSASWRRALWQTVVIAMFIVVMGELNGVRGFLRPGNEPTVVSTPSHRAVVVTFKDAEMPAPLPLDMTLPAPPVTPTPPATISRWQERAAWPVLAWLAGTLLVAGRVLLAQFIALVFRLRCRRVDDAGLNTRAERIRRTLGVSRPVALVENKRAIAPFTFGTLRPVIVLPCRFTQTFTLEQQDAALLHEMAHVAGFDSAWRGLSDLTVALLWWHPLAWLARRELAHASELAADESSLLLQDGPGRLAECLVACAKEMRRPALTTWLGMDGGGFRSALGRRVTRLLELSPQARFGRPVPWYVRLTAPVVCTALLWIGMVMVMKPNVMRDGAWRSSILGSAFAAAAETPAQIAPTPATNAEVAKLIRDGKFYYETGRYDAARTNLQAALKIDPKSQGAAYFLDLVEASLFEIAARKRETTPRAVTNLPSAIRIDAKRQVIYDKLRQIRLAEWGPIDNRPLSEVLRSLNDEIIRGDTGGKGINLFITPSADPAGGGAGPALDPAGLPIIAGGGGAFDLNGVNIRLGTKLKDLTIEEILNILMIIAEKKIKYSVESFGIVISPNNEPRKSGRAGGLRLDPLPDARDRGDSATLHTRFFHVDSNSFIQSLKSVQSETFSGTGRRRGGAGGRMTNENAGIQFSTDPPPTNFILVLKSFFEAAGVDLSAPGRSIFYSDRMSNMMVRATLQELDTVEKALQLLNMNPPQVSIQIKVMEVRRDESNRLGTDLFLGTITNGAAGEHRLAKDLTVDQVRTKAPEAATVTGILTDEQFRMVIKALEQRGGTDLLSAPTVTTLSGRQAQIKVVDVKYIVTDLDISEDKMPKKPEAKPGTNVAKTNSVTVEPYKMDDGRTVQPIAEPFELGPVIDVIPYVNADGYTIQMTVLPSLKEFLGYEEEPLKRKERIDASGGPLANTVPHSAIPLPKFRLRSVAASATVWDGQTMVIAGGTARHVNKERRADGSVTNRTVEKELFFFVTLRLIDAAGNPLHTEEELHFARKNTPGR